MSWSRPWVSRLERRIFPSFIDWKGGSKSLSRPGPSTTPATDPTVLQVSTTRVHVPDVGPRPDAPVPSSPSTSVLLPRLTVGPTHRRPSYRVLLRVSSKHPDLLPLSLSPFPFPLQFPSYCSEDTWSDKCRGRTSNRTTQEGRRDVSETKVSSSHRPS